MKFEFKPDRTWVVDQQMAPITLWSVLGVLGTLPRDRGVVVMHPDLVEAFVVLLDHMNDFSPECPVPERLRNHLRRKIRADAECPRDMLVAVDFEEGRLSGWTFDDFVIWFGTCALIHVDVEGSSAYAESLRSWEDHFNPDGSRKEAP